MKAAHKVLLGLGLGLALTIGLPVLSVMFLVQPVRFQGQSMKPALSDGDKILLLKSFWTPKRGDIVAFKFPMDTTKSYIKRIIGLPGETLEIREGKIFVNDKELAEPYVGPEFNHASFSLPPLQIPEKHYYMVGDNRDHSSDSRSWGTVAEELIYGKYILNY